MAYSPTCGQCKRLLHFRWDIQKRVHLPWPVPAFLECMTAAAVAVSKFDQRSIEPPRALMVHNVSRLALTPQSIFQEAAKISTEAPPSFCHRIRL